MSVYGNDFWSKMDAPKGTKHVVVRETHWGLILTVGHRSENGGFLAETILKLLAICTLFAAILPWVVQTGLISNGTLLMQMSLSAAFFVTGFGIYAHAGRGFQQEVHIDGIQSEIRFATRNSHGASSIRRRVPMRHIKSCFMKLTPSKRAPAQLHLKLKSSGQPLPIAVGEERVLVPVLEQIADFIKVTERHARY